MHLHAYRCTKLSLLLYSFMYLVAALTEKVLDMSAFYILHQTINLHSDEKVLDSWLMQVTWIISHQINLAHKYWEQSSGFKCIPRFPKLFNIAFPWLFQSFCGCRIKIFKTIKYRLHWPEHKYNNEFHDFFKYCIHFHYVLKPVNHNFIQVSWYFQVIYVNERVFPLRFSMFKKNAALFMPGQ